MYLPWKPQKQFQELFMYPLGTLIKLQDPSYICKLAFTIAVFLLISCVKIGLELGTHELNL
jgi:hypothetical protein